MSQRRILSLWFPRLAAERVLRAEPGLADRPLAVVADGAGRAGAREPRRGGGGARGCAAAWRSATPGRSARPRHPAGGSAARGGLPAPRSAAGPGASRPWVRRGGRARALVLDVTGCARLFGGEAGRGRPGRGRGGGLRPHARPRARRHPRRRLGGGALRRRRRRGRPHAGDAIDQEARATRSRAQKRRWERGGAPPAAGGRGGAAGSCRRGRRSPHIGPLPVAALRLEPEEVAALQRARPAADRRRRRAAAGAARPPGRAGRAARGSTRRSAASPSRCRRRGRRRSSRCG